MGKGPCHLGTSFIASWFVHRWCPSSHMRSPSLYLGISLCLTHDFCALIISSWVCCLAILNCSSLRATCGMGDGLLLQSWTRLNFLYLLDSLSLHAETPMTHCNSDS